jgi:ABC-2 type transport system ATP-binding protein
MTALTPSRMRRLISSLVNLLSSSRSILPSMLNPQNTRHYPSGLDPEGVDLVHGLLRELAREGVAVLLSTHHLQEVSRYAHKVGILGGGRLLDEVALGSREVYRLEAHPLEGALALLRALPQVASARIQNGAILFEGDREAVLKALLNEGYRVEALYPQGFDLMAYYQERVKHA